MFQVVPSRYRLEAGDKKKIKELTFDYLKRLINECTVVVPSMGIVKQAWDIYYENFDKRYLSFMDCLVLSTAKDNKYSLFTKDERMKRVAQDFNIRLLRPARE